MYTPRKPYPYRCTECGGQWMMYPDQSTGGGPFNCHLCWTLQSVVYEPDLTTPEEEKACEQIR